MGIVKAVCISEKRGTDKHNVNHARLIENFGIENDAHAGNWHRQVSLLSYETIEEFKKERGDMIEDGAFGENIIVSGYDFKKLPIGTRFTCGDCILELTQVGKECHTHCTIYHTMGVCIMPTEGVFCKVIKGGEIAVDYEFYIIKAEGEKG